MQRNMQQKEHGKNPLDSTNEKELESTPEREFRIMIVKMIKILKTKWRHGLEAQVEKMQEMFNKDLKELQNKQSTMNNTITKIKNTLE